MCCKKRSETIEHFDRVSNENLQNAEEGQAGLENQESNQVENEVSIEIENKNETLDLAGFENRPEVRCVTPSRFDKVEQIAQDGD